MLISCAVHWQELYPCPHLSLPFHVVISNQMSVEELQVPSRAYPNEIYLKFCPLKSKGLSTNRSGLYIDKQWLLKKSLALTNEERTRSKLQHLKIKGHNFFGMTTVELGLRSLLHSFDWKLPNEMPTEDVDMNEALGLALHNKCVLQLVATPRK